jgi:hypothetical protein
VIVPGFISQHDHPVLSALTLASEVLSIEDWVLPSGTIPAVKTKADFLRRLADAEERLRPSSWRCRNDCSWHRLSTTHFHATNPIHSIQTGLTWIRSNPIGLNQIHWSLKQS